jgi:hypothetical protein
MIIIPIASAVEPVIDAITQSIEVAVRTECRRDAAQSHDHESNHRGCFQFGRSPFLCAPDLS